MFVERSCACDLRNLDRVFVYIHAAMELDMDVPCDSETSMELLYVEGIVSNPQRNSVQLLNEMGTPYVIVEK